MIWQRAIILIDMDAFFALIEQLDFPELRGKPVVVTNGEEGTCIITASYEARRYGIKTGVRLPEAKKRCPSLVVCPSRPHRYVQISSAIMKSLESITPDIEVFSVDEAFLDITHCQRLWGSPEQIAKKVKSLVQKVSGVTCSVGVSGDKTTAKFAAKQQKPNGLTVIEPAQAKAQLATARVSELCGIGKGISRFLEERGVVYCGDMEKLPIGVMAKRFGNLGRRIWLMCQAADPSKVSSSSQAAKSLGHGKVIPPNTRDIHQIRTYLRHLCEKLASRLRANSLEAQVFWIGFREQQSHQWIAQKLRLDLPGDHGADIYRMAEQFLLWAWKGQGLNQIQVTALDPTPQALQGDLFNQAGDDVAKEKHRAHNLDEVVDDINQRFGAYTLQPASTLKRSSMNDVIAPAWRPTGSRKSV